MTGISRRPQPVGRGWRDVSGRASALWRVKGVALALTLAAAGLVPAEPAAPDEAGGVNWQIRITPQSAHEGDEADLVFSAEIARGWILYSSDFTADIGPRPARFRFDPSEAAALLGAVRAISPLRRKDRTWHSEYSYFQGRAEFRQRVRITARPAHISGRIDGQACHEEDGTCTLIHKEFDLSVQ